MKTTNNYFRKETSSMRQMRFEVGKNQFSKGASKRINLNTRPTMLKISFQQNKENLSRRMVTSSVMQTLKDNNNNNNNNTNNNNRPELHQNPSQQKQQSIKENPFDKTMSNVNDSDECVFVKEENDEVIFVSETTCDVQISQNEKDRIKENAKRFGVNGGKITKKRHMPYRRFPRNLEEIIKNKIQSEEINRFDSITTVNVPIPFSIDNIRLNPLALLNPLPNEPMSNEAEEKLFAERPDLFEKRMVIIDGSNVARKFSWPQQTFSVQGIEICLQHFESRGFNTKVVLPQWRMGMSKSTDPTTLDRLHRADKIWLSPSKNLPANRSNPYDDRFILEVAEKFDAAVVSNDSYKDLLNENPRWDEIINQRVINYMCCGGQIIFAKDPYGRFGKKADIILHKRKTVKNVEDENTTPNA